MCNASERWNQDDIVTIVNRLWAEPPGIWMLASVRDLSRRNVQPGSAANPPSYSLGNGGSFAMGNMAREWAWPLASIWCWGCMPSWYVLGTTVPVFLMLLGGSHWLPLLQIQGYFHLEFTKFSVTKTSLLWTQWCKCKFRRQNFGQTREQSSTSM